MRFSVAFVSLLVFACGPADSVGGNDGGGTPGVDSDGDLISDGDEGAAAQVDTDGDGTPDYLDTDSDADGVPDIREAGDADAATTPLDSDGDGAPDFQDFDADGNGAPDGVDGTQDFDLDGIADFQDLDDDGDSLADSVEIDDPANPIDSDGDNAPDYRDADSDNDTIGDAAELLADPDGDGVPAYLDQDSDGDCRTDSVEAGDALLMTLPVDSDGDARPDFLDLDSDSDGLMDAAEDANCNGVHDGLESSAVSDDTDGDGVSDLVEVAAGTDVNDAMDNPQAQGDFFFLVPYMDPTLPPEDTLEFATSIQFADIYFSFDTTGSMGAELSAMASNVPSIIDQLQCQPTGGMCMLDSDCAVGVCFGGLCIEDPIPAPGCVPNMWTGVGHWSDLNTFVNLLALQPNPATTAANIPTTSGGGAEAPYQAPACVADDANCTNASNCVAGGVGCVGFRMEAIRILIQITDADNQCSGAGCATFTPAFTGSELIAKDIKFVSLYGTGDEGGAGTAQSVATDLGLASNTVDAMGTPFVYPALDAAVVTQTVQGVLDLVRGIPLDVTIDATDLPGDAGDALQFIDYLVVNVSGTGSCTNVTPTTDTNGDAWDDSFPSLLPGTPVCWDVHPVLVNTTVVPTEQPQIFRAELTVYGDGSPLDTRQVFFLVPPVIVEPPID